MYRNVPNPTLLGFVVLGFGYRFGFGDLGFGLVLGLGVLGFVLGFGFYSN